MTATEYYKKIGIDINKMNEKHSEIVSSFFLDDHTFTKEFLVEEYGENILLENQND
ncbi:hypothetical protein [Mesonia hippocampi]|uniref:hypothetical protein n=1 Tax=Mesonia hippocampi TaxID=1628250 RepID=UPI003F9D4B0A